jgi:hypothetical protein
MRLGNNVTHHARPAGGDHQKLNCTIAIDPALDVIARRKEIDYISLVARGRPFESPTLLCCIYLNPTKGTGDSDRIEALRALY